MQRLIFGSDPELMLVDKDNCYRSAIPIVKAGKERKADLGHGNKLFYDNVLAELNIHPYADPESVVASFQAAFKSAARYVSPFTLVVQSSQTYPEQECLHPDAKVFGCDPEFCAYTMNQLEPPTCEEGNTFRSAGGHIHLGFSEEEYPLRAAKGKDGSTERKEWGKVWTIRMMDLFVGIPSLFLDQDPTSAKRRSLYGGAGTHRPKDYGVEYRAMGNFWIASPELVTLMYRLSEFVVQFVAEERYEKLWSNKNDCIAYDVSKLMECINKGNMSLAKNFMEGVIKDNMPEDLYSKIFIASEPKQYNFYKEWGIRL